MRLTRRQLFSSLTIGTGLMGVTSTADEIRLETRHFIYRIGPDGSNRSLFLKTESREALVPEPLSYFASIQAEGRLHHPVACWKTDKGFALGFNDLHAILSFSVSTHSSFLAFALSGVEGLGIDKVSFLNLSLRLDGAVGSIANVCLGRKTGLAVLPLNLQTDAQIIRSGTGTPTLNLSATGFGKLGLVGCQFGLVVCPTNELRQGIKDLVKKEGSVWSPYGGPWAVEATDNRLSYLFAEVTEFNVDDWVDLARLTGVGELLFYGIGTFGSYQLYPDRFPNGLDGLRKTVERVHRAGLKAGWHMHSFSIQKDDPWVRPVPHPGLAKGHRLTLAADIGPDDTFIPTLQSPALLPERGGYWFRGGTDVQIDEEIIVYRDRSLSPPYGLKGCIRGAYGTHRRSHKKGAAIDNLKEVFAMYAPDPHSLLFDEMCQRIADIINECGFDLIYFDGLDGADIFEGSQWSWHYGPLFAHNVFKRVKRPLRVEASAWYRHIWTIHSRLGAWDHPVRDPKRFIDIHCQSNLDYAPNLLPAQLGWWAFRGDTGFWGPATTLDVIEYLCCKCLAYDWALSLQNIDPSSVRQNRRWWQMARLLGDYERLRLTRSVPESVRKALAQPGAEFSLRTDESGKARLVPCFYSEQKVVDQDGITNHWRFTNPYLPQPLRLRLQVLHSVAPYEDPAAMVIADQSLITAFSLRQTQEKVRALLDPSDEMTPTGETTIRLTAVNEGAPQKSAWAMVGRLYDPPLNLSATPAIGFWVKGDGKGGVLNVQVLDIRGPGPAVWDRYLIVDFTGWRYCELLEPEAKRWSDYQWPYGHPYALYREAVDLTNISQVSFYLNNVPEGESVSIVLGPVKFLPIREIEIVDPSLTINGSTIQFPVSLRSRWYCEMMESDRVQVYDPNGNMVGEAVPLGPIPHLKSGENTVLLRCRQKDGLRPRAVVTLKVCGEPITL
ncbi:MAG: hypothetical protein NZ959_05180 [Armatimonadetes bacterium]|nr:hypothetical protein [Armatimonadota bacterium]MDW8122272.1 hypothetical protein [Armatimonadota bacterium]